MCGDYAASRCSPTKWFHYMGDAANNLYVPFQITYLPQPSTNPVEGYIPVDPKVVPCHEALDVMIYLIKLISINRQTD